MLRHVRVLTAFVREGINELLMGGLSHRIRIRIQ